MSGESVKVVVRCRPMNQREKDLKCDNIVVVDAQRNQVNLVCPEDTSSPPKQFTYDGTYGIESNTEQLYNDLGFPLVESVCEGYNGTVFAYGQTGCGKSFTMQGSQSQKGMIPRAFEHIFEAVASDTSKKYLIRASYLEIYNENIRDLIGKDMKAALDLHEHPEKGVYIADLSWHECKKVQDCEKLMDRGNKSRATGATLMNADSSRSHSIFTVNVEMCETNEATGEDRYRLGKLNLVDLAGSERLAKTGATGDRLKEATKINLSLSALGNVISALVDGKSKHIPYRDSKLTRLLQDSLGGNTKTLMVAVISPAADNYEETLSTLRYANRAKNIKNKPKINEDPKDAMLRQLQEEIRLLKEQLLGKGPSQPSITNQEQIELEKQKLKAEFEEKMQSLKEQYEEEKMSKEALMKKMESIRLHYDNQINSLDGKPTSTATTPSSKPKSARPGTRKMSSNRKHLQVENNGAEMGLASENSDQWDPNDPEQRLMRLQQMVVGGELANDEELKKKRIKKKKYAEDRKKLADALKKDNDDDFMLRVYDNVQEEVQYKSRLMEKEKQKVTFLENEVKDLQREFELEREEYLDTIRKQERQLKLLLKLTQRIQPLIPHDYNYYNLDKIQSMAMWNEEMQDWILPELKREKLSLPNMREMNATNGYHHQQQSENGTSSNAPNNSHDDDYDDLIDSDAQAPSNAAFIAQQYQQQQQQQQMLLRRENTNFYAQSNNQPAGYLIREPEIDRYRMKLENSQFDGSNYFKTKRQSELLSQTQDMKNNGRLSPINNIRNAANRKYY